MSIVRWHCSDPFCDWCAKHPPLIVRIGRVLSSGGLSLVFPLRGRRRG